MDNHQLSAICKSDAMMRAMYLGTFAADMLPKMMPRHTFYISNLQPHFLSGNHWILAYSSGETIYYIDSLGNMPSGKYIVPTLLSYGLPIAYNDIQLQYSLSNYCGLWCTTFAYFLSRNYTPDEIIQTFFATGDLLYNELLIKYFSLCIFDIPKIPSLINIEKLLESVHKNEKE